MLWARGSLHWYFDSQTFGGLHGHRAPVLWNTLRNPSPLHETFFRVDCAFLYLRLDGAGIFHNIQDDENLPTEINYQRHYNMKINNQIYYIETGCH